VASDVSEQLRAEIAWRANHRCEYCLIHENDAGFPHEVDHILSRKHGGASTTDNLAYACVLCNRYKGADVASIDPGTGKLFRLYNPRQDRWSDHFRLEDEVIQSRTEIGSVTAGLLRLNSAARLAERRILQELGRYPRR
jgi:5-methylcytosine-specific restriction endonuclease McrA